MEMRTVMPTGMRLVGKDDADGDEFAEQARRAVGDRRRRPVGIMAKRLQRSELRSAETQTEKVRATCETHVEDDDDEDDDEVAT